MKANVIITTFFSAFLCLLSCESRIDIGDDGLGEMLYMNAQLSTADSVHTVYLALSTQNGLHFLDKARVTCFINGVPAAVTDSVSRIKYLANSYNMGTSSQSLSVFCFKTSFKMGDDVRLRAEYGSLCCEAEVTVPQIPAVRKASLNLNRTDCRWDISVVIDDQKGVDNYYRLVCLDSATDSELLIDNTDEPLLYSRPRIYDILGLGSEKSYYDNRLNIFCDTSFKDGSCSLNVSTMQRSSYQSIDKMNVRVEGLSKEAYSYLCVCQYLDTIERMVSLTDATIPCNVKGGMGFVSVNTAFDSVFDTAGASW